MKRQGRIAAQGSWTIFKWPLSVAVLSLIGLASALIGDGWFDAISWLSLGSTIVLMIAAWRGWSAA